MLSGYLVQLKPAQKSTLLRLSFVLLRNLLSSFRCSFARLLRPFFTFRTFGRGKALRQISSSFDTTHLRFWCCVLYSWEERLKYPSLLMRLALLLAIRSRTSIGNHDADMTWKRSSALVSTLFTFCPPAPEERENDNCTWSRGISILSGTKKSLLSSLLPLTKELSFLFSESGRFWKVDVTFVDFRKGLLERVLRVLFEASVDDENPWSGCSLNSRFSILRLLNWWLNEKYAWWRKPRQVVRLKIIMLQSKMKLYLQCGKHWCMWRQWGEYQFVKKYYLILLRLFYDVYVLCVF